MPSRIRQISEKTPLVRSSGYDTDDGLRHKHITDTTEVYVEEPIVTKDAIVLKRHLSLFHAIAFIVGGVAGSGIFISPTGVTKNVGSVGLSLIIWTLSGIFNLVLALCYSELGTAIPLAGGDYAYLSKILGPLPAFLCLWVTVAMIGPCSGAVMARTVGEYIFPLFGQECHYELTVLLAIWINLSFAGMNTVNVKFTARLMTVLSVTKLIALGVIIVVGIVKLVQGGASNLDDPFAGSRYGPSDIVLGFLPGFVSYAGWDAVNTLAEEMKNPGRDLPLSVVIALLTVTGIYVLTNMAYFTVLTTEEFVASNAVGMSFAAKAIPQVGWLIPVFVAMSAMGSVCGLYLSYPRYTFAGGVDHQLPVLFSHISIKYFTPIPAIILLLTLCTFFSSATFFDLQALLLLLGVIVQLKIGLTLVALIYLKRKFPETPRTVRVPLPIVILCLILLVVIIAIALYSEPFLNGFGCGLFILGIPIYYFGKLCKKSENINAFMNYITMVCQCMLMVVPGGKKK